MGRKLAHDKARLVFDLLASGMPRLEVARRSGVSKSYVYLVHKRVGGVYRPVNTSYSRRYLDREERHEIARLHEGGMSIRAIGKQINRAPSTVSRELRRNVSNRSGNYHPLEADRLAWERQRRPKPSKLSQNPALAARVQQLLDRDFSPQQVAGRLKVDHPGDVSMHISHESIYRSLFVYPRGGLKRELKAALRSGRAMRSPRSKTRSKRGQIPNMVSILERPAEVEGRLIPGHHEGDLVMGSKASNCAVGTIVERTTGHLTLIHLPHGHKAEQVAQAVIDKMSKMPHWFAKTLTWDRGSEMAQHEKITKETNIDIYFAEPYAPYQRGSNENTNGLLRQYLPKGSDFSKITAEELDEIAEKLNNRPRKRLGYYTPNEMLIKLINEHEQTVATTP